MLVAVDNYDFDGGGEINILEYALGERYADVVMGEEEHIEKSDSC